MSWQLTSFIHNTIQIHTSSDILKWRTLCVTRMSFDNVAVITNHQLVNVMNSYLKLIKLQKRKGNEYCFFEFMKSWLLLFIFIFFMMLKCLIIEINNYRIQLSILLPKKNRNFTKKPKKKRISWVFYCGFLSWVFCANHDW